MKKALLLICAIAVSVGTAYSETPNEYAGRKLLEIYQRYYTREGNLGYTISLATAEGTVLVYYKKWREKRFSKKRMIEEATAINAEFADKLMIHFTLRFTGDWQSKGRTSIQIPADFAEFIFLEQDENIFVRCTKADVSMGLVNQFNDSEGIMLEFPLLIEDSNTAITEGVESLRLVIGGLALEHGTFDIELPLSSYYKDAPDLFKEIFVASGIWVKAE